MAGLSPLVLQSSNARLHQAVTSSFLSRMLPRDWALGPVESRHIRFSLGRHVNVHFLLPLFRGLPVRVRIRDIELFFYTVVTEGDHPTEGG